MANERTTIWDAAEHLTSEEDTEAYLQAALDEHDPALIAAAPEVIVRAGERTNLAGQP